MSTLRTGVIGLGEVAQVIHLPVLQSLPEMYEVRAVCDISPTLVKVVGDRYGVPGRYATAKEMLGAEKLDCVLVLNSDEYHAEAVTEALARDVHVMVEKPMCLNVREAHEIIDARDRSGATVMVGYMRRFAPAFLEAKEKVASMGRINYARVHDIIGRNQLIVAQTSTVDRPSDVPQRLVEERWDRGRSLVLEALGPVPDELSNAYRLLCGLGSHDLSAMRELLGRPRGSPRRSSGGAAASSPRCSSTTTSWSPTRPASTTSSGSTPTSRSTARPRASASSTTPRTYGTCRRRS
jgi:predicted dehydrogenase